MLSLAVALMSSGCAGAVEGVCARSAGVFLADGSCPLAFTGFSSKEMDSSEMINTFESYCQLFLMFGHLTCYSLNAILKKSLCFFRGQARPLASTFHEPRSSNDSVNEIYTGR